MGIKFFRKNIIDLTNESVTFDITDSVATTDGSEFTSLMRNRNNNSGWATTGSSDAGSTTIIVDFGDTRSLDNVLLVGHNLKNYTLKYHDGTAYTDFSSAVAPTNNTASTTNHSFTTVETDRLQLIINGTQTANQDKYIKQFIVTEGLGTLSIQPEVMPQWDKDRKVSKFISGKSFVAKSVGAFNCRIRMKSASNDTDLTLIETLYSSYEGFLVWLSGGDESQFTDGVREGYRLEDIFLMDIANEYNVEYVESRWAHGLPIDIKLVEIS